MNWRFWDKSGHDDCAAVEPLLSLYSDGMASPAEKRRVEAHLPTCPSCQQALDWMLSTRQVISLRPSLAPPADLRVRIARAIAEADAAKARPLPVKTPAVTARVRPARHPLTLRPALAYGLSLALFAGVAGDLAWNAAHPTTRRVAVLPTTPTPSTPRVAANFVDPGTSLAINSILGHVNETLRSALVAPGPVTVRHPAARPAHVLQAEPDQSDTAPAPLPSRVAVKMAVQAVPHQSPLAHKSPSVTHLAIKLREERPVLAPKTVVPVPQDNNQQVASANVAPHVDMHTPIATAPAPVTAPAEVHMADRPRSALDGVSRFVADMHTVGLRSDAKFAKAVTTQTNVATADYSTDRSGILPITYAPVK